MLDISDAQKWLTLVDGTIRDLTRLVEDRRFTQTNGDTIASLAQHARCSTVVTATARDTGIIHGDTKGDNVFVTADGYRVIDWQRTMKGPRGVDMAAFLHGHKMNPAEHVDAGVIGIFYFLFVWWLTQCKMQWIPDARSYDGAVVVLEERLRTALQ